MAVAGLTSMVFHIGIMRATYVPPGAAPDFNRGIEITFLGTCLGLGCPFVLLALLRVGRAWAVWLLGTLPAVVCLGLTAFCLGIAGASSLAARAGLPGLTPFVVGDSLAVAIAYGLASLPSDSRLSGRLRFGLPGAVFGLVALAWGLVYLAFYRT